MKIRIMGTREECEVAKKYYRGLEGTPEVKSVTVSDLYANRGSSTVFRVYIDVEYYSTAEPFGGQMIAGRGTKCTGKR